jgi:hypothetical protein
MGGFRLFSGFTFVGGSNLLPLNVLVVYKYTLRLVNDCKKCHDYQLVVLFEYVGATGN